VCPNDDAFGVVVAALTFSSAFGTVAYIAVLVVVDVAAVEKKFKFLLY